MTLGREEVTVLHVDDDEALLSLLEAMMERVDHQFSVSTLQRPTEALERLDDGDIDCVVCDYDMPRMNGLEVLKAIREEYPDLPFILYTGKGSEEIASDAISAGVTDYLQKGSGSEHYELLANRIRKYVERYRANREYELTEERYRRLVEQSMVGIGLSQDGVFEYVNPKFADIFGYETAELTGASIETVVAPSDEDRVRRALASREAGDVESVHYVITGQHKDGERFDVEVNGSRVTYDDGPAVLGLVQPLSTRRRAEASVDAATRTELRVRLEHALAELSDGGRDGDAVRDSIVAALEVLGKPDDGGEAADRASVDLASACRSALSASDSDVDLTVETSRLVVGSQTAVEQLFRSLWDVWGETGVAPTATLDVTEDGFEVAFRPSSAPAGFEHPPNPPAVGRAAELLGWDVHVSRTAEGGRTYAFHGVGDG
ncbi:response regulator [Halorubellus sp. PRR65]|uniref:response regulator n=1 Tax=Halorubellus sp. PRR65 TaxID=3098148 RepID=UPI002B2585B0|nr:response regulator [Halorubellus sp. PRR65]